MVGLHTLDVTILGSTPSPAADLNRPLIDGLVTAIT